MPSGFSRVCTPSTPSRPAHVRRRDEHLAVEAPRAQQRRVELVEQVRRGDHDHAPARGEAVHLDEQLVERLVLLAGDVHPAAAADRVELVDEDDRRFVLAGDREQPADARGAEAGEHLHERRRRLGEELRAGLVRDRLREQRLARPRRAVQEDPLRHLRAELFELLRVAQELDDLLQLAARVVDARDVLPADRLVEAGLICCGLTFGITFSIRHITAMITTKNRIATTGSQFSAQFCRFCTNEVCAAGGAATGATFVDRVRVGLHERGVRGEGMGRERMGVRRGGGRRVRGSRAGGVRRGRGAPGGRGGRGA